MYFSIRTEGFPKDLRDSRWAEVRDSWKVDGEWTTFMPLPPPPWTALMRIGNPSRFSIVQHHRYEEEKRNEVSGDLGIWGDERGISNLFVWLR